MFSLHVNRSKMIMAGSRWLSNEAFNLRKAFYNKKGEGFFHKAPSAQDDPLAAMANQDVGATTGMMMNQFKAMGFSIGSAYLIREFFPGFVVAKTPFPLTFKFKFMLQSDINLPSLDVNYISSMSWYMCCFVAASPIIQLVYAFFSVDGSNIDNSEMIQAQMGMPPPGMNPMGMGNDIGKAFKGAFEALEIHDAKPVLLDSAADRLLELWGERFF